MKLLIQLSSILYYMYLMGQNGQTPLHLSAEQGHEELTSLLINKGADIDSNDKVSILVHTCNLNTDHCLYVMVQDGMTALDIARSNDNQRIIDIFTNSK